MPCCQKTLCQKPKKGGDEWWRTKGKGGETRDYRPTDLLIKLTKGRILRKSPATSVIGTNPETAEHKYFSCGKRRVMESLSN